MRSSAQNLLAAGVTGFLMLAPMLAGCEAPPTPTPGAPTLSAGTTLLIYLDPVTGCQYLGQRDTRAGITPRIAADGLTHMGCKGSTL